MRLSHGYMKPEWRGGVSLGRSLAIFIWRIDAGRSHRTSNPRFAHANGRERGDFARLQLRSVLDQTTSMEQEIDCKMPSISR